MVKILFYRLLSKYYPAERIFNFTNSIMKFCLYLLLMLSPLYSCSSFSNESVISYALLNMNYFAPEEINYKAICCDTISPLNLGMSNARTDVDRYFILYKTHLQAKQEKKTVSYKGIDSLDIEVPKGAKPIPLSDCTDFAGVKIKVLNNSENTFLFEVLCSSHEVKISPNIMDSGDFQEYPQLKDGVKLLCLGDNNPWIEHREQDGMAAPKRDIIVLKDGIAQNKPVMPYTDSTTTRPFAYYFDANPSLKVFKNLVFIRDKRSQYKTWLVQLNGVYNMLFYNLNIITPQDETSYGDKIFQINHCANVVMRDVLINGTYSQRMKFGYGININFATDLKFFHVVSQNTKWGVFCTNCTNNSYLKDCKINRYDVHCYGKDITIEDCVFIDLALPISSVYGKISYKNCTFFECEPITIRDNYYAYVPFDLELVDCKYYASNKSNCIFNAGNMNHGIQLRKELCEQCFPNIKIERLHIIPVNNSLSEFYLFKIKEKDNAPIGYIKDIRISKLSIDGNIPFRLSNKTLKCSNKVNLRVSGSGANNKKAKIRSL